MEPNSTWGVCRPFANHLRRYNYYIIIVVPPPPLKDFVHDLFDKYLEYSDRPSKPNE